MENWTFGRWWLCVDGQIEVGVELRFERRGREANVKAKLDCSRRRRLRPPTRPRLIINLRNDFA